MRRTAPLAALLALLLSTSALAQETPPGEEPAGEPEAGEEAEGEKAEGEKAEGEQAQGEQAQGEEAEGEEARGEKAEGEKAEGEMAEGEEAEGEKAEGEKAEGEKAQGEEARGEEAEGEQAEGEEARGEKAEGEEAQGEKADGEEPAVQSRPPEEALDPEFEELDGEAPDLPDDPPLKAEASADYRVRSLRIDPIELSGTLVRDVGWTEQRARLEASVTKPKFAALTVQLDALDGVLFGDNGSFVGTPKSNSGVSLSAKRPNLTNWEVGLREGGDPLTRDDYGPVLVAADPLEVNYLYADIFLPVGLLRIGRQPLNYGASITSHDGGNYNRWGVSKYSDGVDRILFGTKLDEAVKAITGTGGEPDLSIDNGVIWALFYDILKQDNVGLFNDELRQFGTSVQWRVKEADWFGLDVRDFLLSQSVVHLRNNEFNSRAYGFPFQFAARLGNVSLDAQYMHIRGQTEEISIGFAALASQEPVLQDLVAHAARGVVDVEFGPVTLTLEGDYASGDDDPRSSTPITSFSYARDLNVGLLLFEHIVAFESARSAGVGIENLSGADVESFPLTEASTEGRFTNAIAAFPQLRIDWLQHPVHRLHTQFGGLFAWSAAPGGVVDPIMTSIAEDGETIADDAVNYHGGKPDRFYGTEIDAQVGYSIGDTFRWIVEGAALFPGPALHDENGDAVNSFLVENRFEVSF